MTTYPLNLLAVFAHPDDESFAVGGTLAKYAAAGVRITILTMTRGERSTLGSSTKYAPVRLARRRETELRRAAAALGVADVRILGYPDGGLQDLPLDGLVATVHAAIVELRPAIVLTFDPGGITGHPDHVAVAVATTRAFQEATQPGGAIAPPWHARLLYWALPATVAASLETVASGRWIATPDETIGAVVDVSTFLSVQWRAIACHRTQSSPPPPPLVARLAAQQGCEYFLLADSSRPGDSIPSGDLFAGMTVVDSAETDQAGIPEPTAETLRTPTGLETMPGPTIRLGRG